MKHSLDFINLTDFYAQLFVVVFFFLTALSLTSEQAI